MTDLDWSWGALKPGERIYYEVDEKGLTKKWKIMTDVFEVKNDVQKEPGREATGLPKDPATEGVPHVEEGQTI